MTRTIFEALRESHERQRALYSALTETSGDTPERRELFDQFKTELAAHALAEDRHFYVPLMALDAGMDLSRHAIAEHHEIDEMVEKLLTEKQKTTLASSYQTDYDEAKATTV